MPDTNQPRLLSFTLDDWAVLGGRVSVSLTDGVAMLVGRNGAGKSAILEGFEAISLRAIGKSSRSRSIDSDSIPKVLEMEILTPTGRHLEYRYEIGILPVSIDDPNLNDLANGNSEEGLFSWNERYQYIDGEKEILWISKSAIVTIATTSGPTSSPQTFHPLENSSISSTDEKKWVYAVLNGIRLLGRNVIRQTPEQRRPSLLQVSGRGSSPRIYGMEDVLPLKILRHLRTEEFDELEKICQRIGLGNKIVVQKFFPGGEPGNVAEGESREYIASVLLDGVNIGLLSDGTLRVLSILVELVSPSSGSSTTIIEEPETQIHPGMLAKLLNEIEAYTFGENLILSTHSPQVVAWTKPNKINLVARNNGRTIIRKLDEDEIHNVVEYLCEEGNLGEWIYSGILDD